VVLVGLTGGIGCGKSTAAQAFASLGALTIDADQLSREVIEYGAPGYNEVIARFGELVLTDGAIDRKKLGAAVFGDEKARKDLEAIIHPRVQAALASTISKLSPGEVLVYEIPLLVETGAAGKFDFIVTVESSMEHRIERLRERGLEIADIERRIATQATREQRESVADAVIVNDGDKFDLMRQVESLWESQIRPLSLR
jgi:dephospho-CoA kinase